MASFCAAIAADLVAVVAGLSVLAIGVVVAAAGSPDAALGATVVVAAVCALVALFAGSAVDLAVAAKGAVYTAGRAAWFASGAVRRQVDPVVTGFLRLVALAVAAERSAPALCGA